MSHYTPIEVRFADLDKFQHVNNAVYLTYAEQARISYFDEILSDTIDWKSKGLILARAETNYLSPIVLHDVINVETTCSKVGTKSIHLTYRIWKMVGGEKQEMANGKTVLVGFDYVKNCSIDIPDEWRERLLKPSPPNS